MRRVWRAATIALVAACAPDFGPSDGLVTSPLVLAVKAEPPEAPPGTAALYTALAVGSSAPSSAIAWRFCTAPKPLGDDNVVSPACFDSGSLVAAGNGSPVTAATPKNGCSVFGPATASAGARPPDPDGTGGYYQPLRVDWAGADPTFYLARIECGLANASSAIVTQFAQAYVANANPHLTPLVATSGGSPAALAAIATNAHIAFSIGWGASDAQTYAYYDPSTETLTTKRESMEVTWRASAGAFDAESTGRSETDPETTTANGWTAPGAAGPLEIWIVLRDSRGGVDFATYGVDVEAP